jgi:hypothetical protein
VAIRLILIRDDPRARALLADVARRLELDELEPNVQGNIDVAVESLPDADEWQRVRGALEAADDDWWQYVHLPRHAARPRGGAPSP